MKKLFMIMIAFILIITSCDENNEVVNFKDSSVRQKVSQNLSNSIGTISNPQGITTTWYDQTGTIIKNQCGCIMEDGGTFYWYGWDMSQSRVNCYKSATLSSNNWSKVWNDYFPMFGSGFHGRPDVIKHPTNGTYVMIVEFISTLGRNGIEYLTSTSPTGQFVSVKKEDYVLGNISMGDKGIYQDDDVAKTAYLLCTTDDVNGENSKTKIVKLNANYIGQNSVIQSWQATPRHEALAMFKRNGKYYLTASCTSWWNSSATYYKTASSITGTWTEWKVLPTNSTSNNSFDTQHDFIVKIVGSSVTSYFYMGDRWGYERTGISTNYNNNAWFPLTFDSSGVPTLQGKSSWTINPVSGVIDGESQMISFSPTKDAMVKLIAHDLNFGLSTQLQVSNMDKYEKQIFLQFDVQVPAGAIITGSQLVITSQTTIDCTVMANTCTDTSWIESGNGGIMWDNKPNLGTTISSVSNHIAGVGSVWDVSSYIIANGNVTIGLNSDYSGDTNFNSREATDTNIRPKLIVTYQP